MACHCSELPAVRSLTSIAGGDGTNVAINDRTLSGLSAIYSTSEDLGGLSRMIINAQGQVVSPYDPVNNTGGSLYHVQRRLRLRGPGQRREHLFEPLLVLNKIDPSLIAISGRTDVSSPDSLSGSNGISASFLDLTLTDLGKTGRSAECHHLWHDRTTREAIAVGSSVSSSSTPRRSLVQHEQYCVVARATDKLWRQTHERHRLRHTASRTASLVADAIDLYYTLAQCRAALQHSRDGTGNLPAGFTRPTSVEFIANNGVNALLVGGLNTPLTCISAPNGCVVSTCAEPDHGRRQQFKRKPVWLACVRKGATERARLSDELTIPRLTYWQRLRSGAARGSCTMSRATFRKLRCCNSDWRITTRARTLRY